MEDDILSLRPMKRTLTAPRKDKDINPRLLHRIKTYIGTDSLGTINNRKSYFEQKGDIKRFGNLANPKKTDTKIELVIASLVVMGYTVASIAETSKELFGIELSKANVMAAYKRVLMAPYRQKQFLNKLFREEDYESNAG